MTNGMQRLTTPDREYYIIIYTMFNLSNFLVSDDFFYFECNVSVDKFNSLFELE